MKAESETKDAMSSGLFKKCSRTYDNALSKGELKNLIKTESSQIGSKQNTSRPCEDTPASQLALAPKKNWLELECRKDLKVFFHLKNGQRGSLRLKNVKCCLVGLLGLFKRQGNAAKFQNEQYSLSPLFSDIYKEYSNWNNQKLARTDLTLILILTIHPPNHLSLPTFDIELLSCSGKNIYSKIEFDNWQIIFSELNAIKAKNDRVLYFVAGRTGAFSFLNQNRELSTLLGRFVDLQSVENGELDGCLEKSLTSAVSAYQAELIGRVLKQYSYVKSCLARKFGWEGRPTTHGETQLLIILNNLIANVPVLSEDGDIFEQIRPHWRAMSRAIEKCLKWDIGVCYGQHYPDSLENAQACWMCRRRVYTYCPTCSLSQQRRTSICLKCYELHHRGLHRREEGHSALLEEWERQNREVEAMLWRPFSDPAPAE